MLKNKFIRLILSGFIAILIILSLIYISSQTNIYNLITKETIEIIYNIIFVLFVIVLIVYFNSLINIINKETDVVKIDSSEYKTNRYLLKIVMFLFIILICLYILKEKKLLFIE